MDPQLLGRGFILGLTIAAAVGPITLLVIRRTLGSGWLVGMASGLGVATADATYGAIAAFGISAASELLVSLARPLGLIGGAVLLVIGTRTVRDAHVPPVATPASLSDVIVTSSHEEVDLADPDVRALLVSLIDDEIELAKVCRAQGQTLDAILQLTEAEKTCTALGLDNTLTEVRALLAELQS